jgi:hypothetical protein
MATTPHTGLTLLEQAQAQKEITINEALTRLDALLNMGVVDRDLAAPPSSPAAGAVYLVASAATGAWAGKTGQLAYFDQVWRFVVPNEGMLVWVNDENLHLVFNGTSWDALATGGGGGSGGGAETGKLVQGRISLSSGAPVTTSDVAGAGTLYYTPYGGNQMALYASGSWSVLAFSETSLAVPATSNTNYDLFAYNNSGTLALEATAWSSDTARATALAWQDGVLVRSGAPTRRYLGSFRTGSVAGQTHDSRLRRFVWNYYHRTVRLLQVLESTASWTYSTGSWRQANGNSANRVELVIGVVEEPVSASVMGAVANSSTTARNAYVAIGLDTAASGSGMAYGGVAANTVTQMPSVTNQYTLTAGYHYFAWVEAGAGADTQTWTGNGLFGLTAQMRG